jgi:DNA repair exonuclease SbcCD ATPase subunit
LIETAIYVLIGAFSTALLFLLAIPAISRRAHRLAQRRASLTAPLSAAEARADSHALRAKHAVEIAGLERRVAAAEAQWATAQIALGRHTSELRVRDGALTDRSQELARRAEEISRLAEEAKARDTEIAAREIALFDLSGQHEAAERRATQATERLQAQRMRFDEDRADLESRIAALTRELSDARQEANAALAAAQARAAELRRRLEDSEREAERLRERTTSPEAPSGPGLPRAHGLLEPAPLPEPRENELNLRVNELMAARSEAETALLAARVDRESLAREVADLGDRLSASESRVGRLREGDALLRQAIARLGREMAEAVPARATPPERETASTL